MHHTNIKKQQYFSDPDALQNGQKIFCVFLKIGLAFL